MNAFGTQIVIGEHIRAVVLDVVPVGEYISSWYSL